MNIFFSQEIQVTGYLFRYFTGYPWLTLGLPGTKITASGKTTRSSEWIEAGGGDRVADIIRQRSLRTFFIETDNRDKYFLFLIYKLIKLLTIIKIFKVVHFNMTRGETMIVIYKMNI